MLIYNKKVKSNIRQFKIKKDYNQQHPGHCVTSQYEENKY